MIDPATASAVIAGLVGTLSAYMTYKVGMQKAEQERSPQPAEPDRQTVEQGEKTLTVIQDVVSQHGTPDEQTALIGFKQNPAMFRPVLEQALISLAAREPGLVRQFQTIAEHASVGGTTITASAIAAWRVSISAAARSSLATITRPGSAPVADRCR